MNISIYSNIELLLYQYVSCIICILYVYEHSMNCMRKLMAIVRMPQCLWGMVICA